jgi:hypothetical protein
MNAQTGFGIGINRKRILAALPVEARRKLQRFERMCDRASAEADGLWNKIHGLRAELDHHVVLREQRRSPSRGPRFQHTADIVTEREKELQEEIRDLQEVAHEATKLAAPYRDIVHRAFAWIEAVVSSGGRIAAVPAAAKEKGDIAAAVAVLRKEIASIETKIAELENAPPPAEELKSLAREAISRLARDGEPVLFTGTRSGDPLKFPNNLSVELLAWACGEALVSRVEELIDNQKLEGAIGTADRDKKMSKLAAEQLALERREEALIETAENMRIIIKRRPAADIRAVLGITDE